MRRVRSSPSVCLGLLLSLGSLALLWPALLNGGPFWFPDTSNYVRAADAAVVYVTGERSEWSNRLSILPEGSAPGQSSASSLDPGAERLQPTRPVYAGRSIYYGFFLYLPMILLGSWGAISLQALVTVGTLLFTGRILARELRLRGSKKPLWGFALVVLATPLPFYTSMLMPDVYSGLLILTLTAAIAFSGRLTRRESLILVLASALFATFHNTHLLIAAAVGAAAFVVAVLSRRRLSASALAVPVVLVGAASIVLFNWGVQMALKEEPFSPPFLSARLVAAGPGTDYLERNCVSDADPFLLCRHRDRLPLESDAFLWSEDSREGLFQMLTREEQLGIAAQDKSFFVATLTDDPLGFASSAGSAALDQLVSFDLKNFNYPGWRTEALSEKYPRRVAEAIAQTRAAKRDMPTAPFVWLSVASTLVALGVIVAVAVRAQRRNASELPKEWWDFLTLVLIGLLANAAICGALSGPHARYQMRLIWIVPLGAALTLIAARRRDPTTNAAQRELEVEST